MGGFGSGSQLEDEQLVAKLAPCGDATHEVKLGLVHGLELQHAGVVAQWMLCDLWVWTRRRVVVGSGWFVDACIHGWWDVLWKSLMRAAGCVMNAQFSG